jgi:hypothetical protein
MFSTTQVPKIKIKNHTKNRQNPSQSPKTVINPKNGYHFKWSWIPEIARNSEGIREGVVNSRKVNPKLYAVRSKLGSLISGILISNVILISLPAIPISPTQELPQDISQVTSDLQQEI